MFKEDYDELKNISLKPELPMLTASTKQTSDNANPFLVQTVTKEGS